MRRSVSDTRPADTYGSKSNIRALAWMLGGEVSGRRRVLAPGPGHSDRDRSLSVLFDETAPQGFVTASFAGDDWRACRDHVRDRLGVVPRLDIKSSITPPELDKQKLARTIWEESRSIAGTLAQTYLECRGLEPAAEWFSGDALRFHPGCPFRLETGETVRLPALTAVMRDDRTDAFRGVHRTALAADGRAKSTVAYLGSAKKMLGAAGGASVKISPDEDVCSGLHIAEGIETALACLSMGHRPIWAVMTAGAVGDFPVLAGIEVLTIFEDHDAAGRKAAERCGSRWFQAGLTVRFIRPRDALTDFADRWRA